MKPLTPKTRYVIIYSYNCGQSGRIIAEKLGCSKTAVYDVLKRFRETGSFTPKKKPGRPPLFNSPTRQKLKAFVQANGKNRRLCSKKIATVWTARKKQP
ncbi:hypothetical protein RhiirA5_439917, partial [Rhizophagus irregularis]